MRPDYSDLGSCSRVNVDGLASSSSIAHHGLEGFATVPVEQRSVHTGSSHSESVQCEYEQFGRIFTRCASAGYHSLSSPPHITALFTMSVT